MTHTYTCESCGVNFTGTAEEAFDNGWDTPERFLSHCTCPDCPIDRTAWWKLTITQEQLTEEEVQRIQEYNKLYTDSQILEYENSLHETPAATPQATSTDPELDPCPDCGATYTRLPMDEDVSRVYDALFKKENSPLLWTETQDCGMAELMKEVAEVATRAALRKETQQ